MAVVLRLIMDSDNNHASRIEAANRDILAFQKFYQDILDDIKNLERRLDGYKADKNPAT